MPKGIFTILLPIEADYKVLGYYFSDKRLEFEVSSNIFLRLNLDHENNEYNLLKLKDVTIISYLHKAKGRFARKAAGLIIGLILDEDDDSEKLRVPLKNVAESLEKLELLNISKEEIETQLEKFYNELLDTISLLVDPNIVKDNVINRTKDLLSGKKKERTIAKELMDAIEAGDHLKVSENYKLAEEAVKDDDLKGAVKFYEKAAEFAERLLEKELAKSLIEKAESLRKIPMSKQNLERKVQQARNFLRKEQFNAAYIAYKKASEIAKELMLPDEEEEYRLKSKALQDFYQVDQEFKKKKH
ncbi:MAG: hypothetical protein ACTSR8_02120 [Promethearchaeota archaeon]